MFTQRETEEPKHGLFRKFATIISNIRKGKITGEKTVWMNDC